ncbi:MAG: J domain-containing protein [Desulfobulbaceae bacterium]|nr:J domain-containing protein [Desulfobulbaceae bacterium]
MKESDRERLLAARDLLGLGESASLVEVRRAYRELAKQHHPDVAAESSGMSMPELTNAYQLLVDYCSNYAVPLALEEMAPQSDEEWWMDRFGHDPLWSKG